jgi:hypothetical protein
LVKALEELQPDCLLIEGPPEADDLLALAGAEGMEPPVALLLYAPEAPKYAVFYPFAEFSPEWQAIRYALRQGVPVQWMDLPQTHALALAKESETVQTTPTLTFPQQEGGDSTPFPLAEEGDEPDLRHDPLGWLGQAAGYGGGEEWWEHTVEQRQDGTELFAAIAEALTAVRAETPPLSDAVRGAARDVARSVHAQSHPGGAETGPGTHRSGLRRVACAGARGITECERRQRTPQGAAENQGRGHLDSLDL